MSKATFGCGTFLPGEGPGNIPNFEGGGTIDSGGGGGVEPPEPPEPPVIGPPIVDPARPPRTPGPEKTECYCKPDQQVYPYKTETLAIYTRVEGNLICTYVDQRAFFSYTCTKLKPGEEKVPDPADTYYPIPPAGGSIVSISGPTNPLNNTCGDSNGECGGTCADRTIDYTTKVCEEAEGPITGGGPPTGPTTGGPASVGGGGPGTGGDGKSFCVFAQQQPITTVGEPKTTSAGKVIKFTLTWPATCRFINTDPNTGNTSPPPPPGPWTEWWNKFTDGFGNPVPNGTYPGISNVDISATEPLQPECGTDSDCPPYVISYDKLFPNDIDQDPGDNPLTGGTGIGGGGTQGPGGTTGGQPKVPGGGPAAPGSPGVGVTPGSDSGGGGPTTGEPAAPTGGPAGAGGAGVGVTPGSDSEPKGPTTGDPQIDQGGPVIPGGGDDDDDEEAKSYCYPVGEPSEDSSQSSGGNDGQTCYFYKRTWKMECQSEQSNPSPSPSYTELYDELLGALKDGRYKTGLTVTVKGFNPDSPAECEADSECPDAVLTWQICIPDDVDPEPNDPLNPLGSGGQGGGVGDKQPNSESGVISNAISKGEIDLDDPVFVQNVLTKKPFGIQDSKIAFKTTPDPAQLVFNDTGYTELFDRAIDSNLHYILKNKNNKGNWESTKTAGITPEVIYDNLKPEVKEILSQIKNYDGTNLSVNQIFNMIGSRVLDGTITRLSVKYLKKLAQDSKKRVPVVIKKSTLSQVNEVAALSLVDKNKFTLDKEQVSGRDKEILKNWKVLPSDVDMYVPITINGVEKRYYINDDGTFIDDNSLSLKDGDFINIRIRGGVQKFFAKSEKDHAFLLPEKTRQKAISLLGGEGGRTLMASGSPSVASSIEFNSSLSSPRQEYYLLSANLETLDTKPGLVGSFLLKDTTIEYGIMDTSTVAGKQAADEYIKYKANKRIFLLDDTDLLLDYVESTGKISLKQTDIIFDSPKENKSVPLLTRQIPWFIMLYPTNRPDYNLFNQKSKIEDIQGDGTITRVLECKTSIVPEFSKGQTNKFIRYATVDRDGVDVYGDKNTQARKTVINVNDAEFKTAYRDRGVFKSTSEYTHKRPKTSFRLLKEIITELDTNYELSINGIGKSLTEFDVYSRLNLEQFNKLSRLENFNSIKASIQNGLINNVKVVPAISRADKRISFRGTQLVQRKRGAGADTFRSIKRTNTGETIVPPDTEGQGGFEPGR
jgi:hypothetical protein